MNKFLPYCNERYFVTEDGSFKKSNGDIIESVVVEDLKMIRLQWLDGDSFYNVASIICVLKFNIQIPTIYWDQIEAIFKDGNRLNVHPSNIIAYRFKRGPIEIREFPGFFYIPYFTKYGVNKDLELLNLELKTLNKWIITNPKERNRKGGYLSARAKKDDGIGEHTTRHRICALTFLQYDSNPWELVINHKDGIPGNDFKQNLEWTTKAINNKHAYDNNLFPNKVVPILVKNLVDNSISRFPTLVSCSMALAKSEGFLRSRIRNQNRLYPDKLAFKFDDGTPWLKTEEIKQVPYAFRSIIVRNIFTNERVIYENAKKASEACGVSPELIYNRARAQVTQAINGYNFRLVGEKILWPNHSPKHLQIYRDFPLTARFGILITDKHDDEIAFYTSLYNASIGLKIDEQTIMAYCRSRSFKDGKYFKCYRLTDNLGPSIV